MDGLWRVRWLAIPTASAIATALLTTAKEAPFAGSSPSRCRRTSASIKPFLPKNLSLAFMKSGVGFGIKQANEVLADFLPTIMSNIMHTKTIMIKFSKLMK